MTADDREATPGGADESGPGAGKDSSTEPRRLDSLAAAHPWITGLAAGLAFAALRVILELVITQRLTEVVVADALYKGALVGLVLGVLFKRGILPAKRGWTRKERREQERPEW